MMSKHDVEIAIEVLDLDEPESEQLRKFYARQKPGFKPNWKAFGLFCLQVICLTAAAIMLIILALALQP